MGFRNLIKIFENFIFFTLLSIWTIYYVFHDRMIRWVLSKTSEKKHSAGAV